MMNNNLNSLLNSDLLLDTEKPKIKLFDRGNFYELLIHLNNFSKDKIFFKYINNFLILNLYFKNKDDDQVNIKRMFYLKDVDIDKTSNAVVTNLIFFKIPKT